MFNYNTELQRNDFKFASAPAVLLRSENTEPWTQAQFQLGYPQENHTGRRQTDEVMPFRSWAP